MAPPRLLRCGRALTPAPLPIRERGSAPCAGRPTRPKLRPCFARRPRLRAPHVNDREDTMLHRAPLGALAAGLLMLSGTALAQQPPAPSRRRSGCSAGPGLGPLRTPRDRRRGEARADRAAADPHRGRQAAGREAQSAAGLQGRGLRGRRRQRALAAHRRQGHGVRRLAPARQGLCHDREGRQARGQGDRVGPAPPQRARLPQGRALRRRAVEGLALRRDRGPSRQPAEADARQRQLPQGRAAWLEVHRHRAG